MHSKPSDDGSSSWAVGFAAVVVAWPRPEGTRVEQVPSIRAREDSALRDESWSWVALWAAGIEFVTFMACQMATIRAIFWWFRQKYSFL